jgi:hypothetical protein
MSILKKLCLVLILLYFPATAFEKKIPLYNCEEEIQKNIEYFLRGGNFLVPPGCPREFLEAEYKVIVPSMGGETTLEFTPLGYAIYKNDIKMAKQLLMQGVAINDDNVSHAIRENPEMIELFIEKGFNMNKTLKNIGITPLAWAAFASAPEVIKILLKEVNIDPDALDYARKSKNNEIRSLFNLVEYEAPETKKPLPRQQKKEPVGFGVIPQQEPFVIHKTQQRIIASPRAKSELQGKLEDLHKALEDLETDLSK